MEETHGRISRSQLSHALHYNAEYLNQIVKRRTGQSLLKLAGSYRLDWAKQLLTSTDKSVTEIVEELGFSGTSHFYDFFRKETGMSPLEYRGKESIIVCALFCPTSGDLSGNKQLLKLLNNYKQNKLLLHTSIKQMYTTIYEKCSQNPLLSSHKSHNNIFQFQ